MNKRGLLASSMLVEFFNPGFVHQHRAAYCRGRVNDSPKVIHIGVELS
jgi:hypothetical protein